MQVVLAGLVVVGMLIIVPLWLWRSLRGKSMGELMYGPQGKRKSTAAIGSALQELDRLLARPSIEYRIEAEDSDKLVENEKGGD